MHVKDVYSELLVCTCVVYAAVRIICAYLTNQPISHITDTMERVCFELLLPQVVKTFLHFILLEPGESSLYPHILFR